MAVKKTGTAKKTPVRKTGAPKPSAKAGERFGDMEELIIQLRDLMQYFMDTVQLFSNLTPKERERLIGAGVRNYGFIEKARDIAMDNPDFLPPNFNVRQFSNNLHDFDLVRQFYLLAEKLQTSAFDCMLLKSNDLYREALRVYNTLKEQAKGRVPGARDLFMALESFFKRRRVTERPPTEAEELRKARSLIKGKTEGEMIIRNIKPKSSGGVHEVVEDLHKDRIAGKESAGFSETE